MASSKIRWPCMRATYRFDQSDSTNSAHPLRFSITPNGTHGGGIIYNRRYNRWDARKFRGIREITVAIGAPVLYYYCVHSGMGGFANTFKSQAKGQPKYYSVFDVNNFLLSPTPDSDYTMELHYYYRPTSITVSGDGASWLGTNAPNTLLYGSLVEAYIYMKGEADMVQLYEGRFQESISRLKNYGEGVENTDAYRSGLVRVART